MNIEHPDKLPDLLTLLKKHGVRHFELGSLKVDFAPVEAAAEPQPIPEDLNCKCGHATHQHNNGFCLIGCEPEKCAPPEK